MEQHGKNPQNKIIAVIPARYHSVRLAGKLLLPIAGKPLILHTLDQVAKSESVGRIVVAADDERIIRVVEDEGFEAVMTSADHNSGTDRIAEAASSFSDDSIIVNVQADEPQIDPAAIDAVVKSVVENETVEMATCCESVRKAEDVPDPNIVKVVIDANGFAVYFSRSAIPFPRDAVMRHATLASALENEPGLTESFKKHTGLYVYRHAFLLKFANAGRGIIEEIEMLEQLRAMEMGVRIRVVEIEGASVGVDTMRDYERVRRLIEAETV